jgi:hypothetical protein
MWLSEKEASEILSIDQKTLEVLRERGFLKQALTGEVQ